MSWDSYGGGGGDTWNDAGADSFDEPTTKGIGADTPSGFATFVDDVNDEHGDAAGGFGSGGCLNDGACFNCGEPGHSKADCPNPAKPRACFNCGEEGHNKADCTNAPVPREFTGTCRLCEKEGHRAADCPDAPPRVCKNCQEEGHQATECKNPRKIDRSEIQDMPADEAWKELIAASDERDLDDIKMAALKYIKAIPDVTYVELEKAFRSQHLNVYLIATEKELAITYTNMNLQGNLDRKYTVSWRLSEKPKRPKEKEGWPATPEENMERLKDAGEPIDRGIPKCGNCEKLGHVTKSCPEEKTENADKAVVKCYNCEEIGHRVRDCPNPRPDKFACRNCKKSGHSSKECPEPRSAEGVECKKCGETGHFAKDCPTGGGGGGCRNCGQEGHIAKDCTEPRKIVCRNCDEEGHVSKDCTKPRDWSRVQCSNCKQMGHTKTRCKSPLVTEDTGFGGGSGGNAGYSGDAVGGDDFGTSTAVASGGGSWENAAKVTSSGW